MSDWTIHFGDCRTVLPTLAAGSVHTCVTSPPYYGLRDYGVDGQIGLEKTPYQYVAEMVAVFREVRRVLRDDGTLWLNLGDSYTSMNRGGRDKQSDAVGARGADTPPVRHAVKWGSGGGTNFWWRLPAFGTDLKPKDLLGIPWRVAFALQADGWYLRQDIIWAKPNPMPESVRDRCTKAHEYIFLLAKSARYYYDAEAVKVEADTEPHAPGNLKLDASRNDRDSMMKVWGADGKKNRRSVWTVTPKPFKGAHFATFPPDLIEPCILAGCPVGGTVLDPFNGSGTTGMVAMKHGRKYVGIELNPDYIKMSEERITKAINERPMFAAGLTKTGGGVA